MTDIDRAFVASLVAFVCSLVASPLVYRLLIKTKSRQKISEYVPEHAEKQGTPTMGGIVVLVALAAGLFFVPAAQRTVPLILLIGFAVVGFLDDFVLPRTGNDTRGLGWKPKFLLEIFFAVAAYWLGGVRDPWAMAFLVFVVLFFSNAYNFVDGMDALAGGIGVLLALGFCVVARLSVLDPSAALAVFVVMGALAAGFVPFLFYNAPPAKLFMGDVGALPIGALLGWAFLIVGRKSDLIANGENLWVAVLMSGVLILELVPVPLQVLSAKLR
ncbi:MAG TPA: hypothetical protein VNI20_04835, partial [Fimbriimonadaceae bacterium]|nr:hypothetical protein [Fimbriimonadaceae bacterium]